MPTSTYLETSIASSCLSLRLLQQYLRPSLVSGSGIIRLFAAAVPPHAFLFTLHYVFTAQKQVVSLLHRQAPPRSHTGAHPYDHTKHCCIVVVYKVSIPTFATRQAPFKPREASLALVTPGTHLRPQTSALSYPSVKYSFCCFHCMRYPPQLCSKYETIFSSARRKS